MSDRETVGMREAASMLDVSLQHVYRLVWEGRLSAVKIDGKWRISAEAVQSRLDKKAGTQ
jgi:excisionase family DNA binding protein